MSSGALVIDARTPQAFAGGHIPGSYNIWLDGIASYLGWIVPHGTPVVLVLPDGAGREEVTRTLLRLGYDEIVGYLHGGFTSWQNEGRELERFGTLDTVRLQSRLDEKTDEPFLLDVRKPSEVAEGSIPGAEAIFLGELERRADEVPRDRDVITMCGVGSRASIAASILARKGHRRVFNYLGGFSAWMSRDDGGSG
jgi:hydroxyacylglutathione hydrolase